jgi:2-polyprenyl-3-methyl-5-hydroxy-6-metoxy-1,4-benzoquinol methylase
MQMMATAIDENHPAYLKFLECFIKGASLQDIYSESEEGFGVRQREGIDDPVKRKQQADACRVQFARIFEHMRNLSEPIDRHVGLAGKKVLDFGCGTGALAVAVALKGAEVTAVDPTQTSLDALVWRARYFGLDDSKVHPQRVSIDPGLPFADQSFDMVTCNSVFEFIPARRDAYIRDLARLIKPGGHLVISTENGLFPIDYYTRKLFPLFRREEMVRLNVPYGMTYFELRRWVSEGGRTFKDLSLLNWFNSIDHFVQRRRAAGQVFVPMAFGAANTVLKAVSRLVGLPSQVFLPYTTFIFEAPR